MEQFFKEDHQLTKSFYATVNDFNEGDQGQSIVVDIMWGLNGINKTGVDRFNASDIGSADWDKEFDMSSKQAQQDILQFCKTIKNQKEILYNPPFVQCWIEDFIEWLDKMKMPFPVDVNNSVNKKYITQQQYFTKIIIKFSKESEKGIYHRTQSNIGFIDNKLVFMKFSAKASGGIYDPYSLKNPKKLKWDNLLKNFN